MRLFTYLCLMLVSIKSFAFFIEVGNEQIEERYVVANKCDTDSLIVSCRKFMMLKPLDGFNAQGAACYGDFFIQGYDKCRKFSIYNLRKKTHLADIDVVTKNLMPRCHVNTLNFGKQKYSPKDIFPLLYASSGYTLDGVSFIYVYRLYSEGWGRKKTYRISHVQTICIHGFGGWIEGVVDADANELWVKYEGEGIYGYSRFTLPSHTNSSVNLYYKDALSNFSFARLPQHSSNQGHVFNKGRIVLASGAPTGSQELALLSINPIIGRHDYYIDLAEIGLIDKNNPRNYLFEPESVIAYKGQLMICYRSAIYAIDIKKKSLR